MEEHIAQDAGVMIDVPTNAPSWLALLFMTIVGFFVRRDLKRMDDDKKSMVVAQKELVDRVTQLEVDRVKRGDINYLAERMTEMTAMMNEQHISILKSLATPINQRKAPNCDL